GLEVGSAVKMRGVTMGSVKKIRFVYEEYDTDLSYVYVLFSCDPQSIGARRSDQTPEELRETVKQLTAQGMRLSLDVQGITGTAILDAQFYEPGKFQELKIDWDPKHPYIQSISGKLARMGETLEKTLDKLSQIDFVAMGEKVNQSLTSVSKMLTDEIEPMVSELRAEIIPALVNIRKSAETTPEIMARVNIIQEGITDWIREQKGSLAEVVDNLQAISENLRQLTENARRDPSQVIFGEPPPPSKVIK
ncbi:MAG TPA: MCE family protein, partial [Proteobacteria bacterium]|nr:MCE family protein [Pseudomonadota bacterium]